MIQPGKRLEFTQQKLGTTEKMSEKNHEEAVVPYDITKSYPDIHQQTRKVVHKRATGVGRLRSDHDRWKGVN